MFLLLIFKRSSYGATDFFKEKRCNRAANDANKVDNDIADSRVERGKDHQSRCKDEAHNRVRRERMVLIKDKLHKLREEQKSREHSDSERDEHSEIKVRNAVRHLLVDSKE